MNDLQFSNLDPLSTTIKYTETNWKEPEQTKHILYMSHIYLVEF